ncbi:hypothetical protein [Methylobacterium sp. J-076]|uniref:hypothetical protein n=1 Tax=Methylobacterium sp. J-076 TaxID=2836655 RepID=UPI001FBB124E|nr:hypothetical protein [Methylobacterium sp. J-076]MCJ2015555.1 hypothetical protein [Methylobacterium sp. J-076]
MLAREMAKAPYMQSLKVDGRREVLLDLLAELPFEVPSNLGGYVRGDAEISELVRFGRSLMKSPGSFETLLEKVGPQPKYEQPPSKTMDR